MTRSEAVEVLKRLVVSGDRVRIGFSLANGSGADKEDVMTASDGIKAVESMDRTATAIGTTITFTISRIEGAI